MTYVSMIFLRFCLMQSLLMMLCFLGVGVELAIAAPTSTSSPTPTSSPIPDPDGQAPAKPDEVSQKLLGQWLTKEPLGGEMVMFVFAPDGQAFLVSGQSAKGNALARPIQYRINATTKPMQIDLIVGKDAIVQTLFEVSPEGDLRLQMTGTSPGNTRPTTLSDEATTFLKISDATTLPPDTELVQNNR